ncbi:hypothetical protein [Flagellimonas eckloniae]|uniref:Uncharacterized protein n=1 Tax=Flagellimonas eckloniae TaxID=346185 RepID=A0A0Q1CGZ4_9FLAO|nr:hypothetical protein [Allomuricauda eckloniae]KQC30191.1 hypothetical protein AAY42_10115 [Allomuricauda eckloniae]
MEDLKIWALLYREIATKLSDAISEVEWLDLWHNQVGFLEDEHNFTTPAVFLAFSILGEPEDLGVHAQRIRVQVDVYYYYETFEDTYNGAYNQTDALTFLNCISEIHAVLHGSSGDCYSECKRVGFGAVDTGSAGNLYRQSFTMLVEDASASPPLTEASPGDVVIEKGSGQTVEKEKKFLIP